MTAVLAASLALIAYAFVGYPLVMAVAARLFPRAIARAPFTPEVAVIVVVHDGAALIARKLASCLAQDYPVGRLRVVVASDGSTDATVATAEAIGTTRVQVLAFPQRRGKAACLNDAIAACPEPIVVLTDVRQPLDPSAVRLLVENFADPAIGAVSGELAFVREGLTGFGESVDAYWRYEKWLRRVEGRVASTIGVSGALYALRRECFRPIPAETILDDVLIPMNVVLQGRRVAFESGAVAWDEAAKDAGQERRRKVRTLAGNFQLLALRPALLLPWRNPVWFQFLSHKVARLLVPPALLAAFVANAWLAPVHSAYAALFAAQSAAYALALLGLVAPTLRLRLVKVPAAFVLFNWFVVLGFVEYVANRDAHLWKTR